MEGALIRQKRRGCTCCGISRRIPFEAGCVIVAFVVLVMVTVLNCVGQQFANSIVRQYKVMDGTPSSAFDAFLNASLGGVNQYYFTFFTVTNTKEILEDPNTKPAVEEVGPFVYDVHEVREVDGWDEERQTITYRQHSWTVFNPEATLGATNGKYDSDEGVKITNVNLVFQAMLRLIPAQYWRLVSAAIWPNDHARLFETRTPRELLYGYSVNLDLPIPIHLDMLKYPGLLPNLPKAKDPDWQKPSTMLTGKNSLEHAFTMVKWRNDSQTKVTDLITGKTKTPWDAEAAHGFDPNLVSGSVGEQFSPGLFKDVEQLDFFLTIAARLAKLVTKPGEEVHCTREEGCGALGVPVRRVRLDYNSIWANATENPAHAAYYQWGPSGLVNMSVLNSNAPVFLSPAHFLGADSSLQNGVTGLHPNPGEHEFYIDLEPRLGIPIRSSASLMVSARISGLPDVPGLGAPWFPALGDRSIYVPVAWFSQRFKMKHETLSILSLFLAAMRALEPVRLWVSVAALASAACFVSLSVLQGYRQRRTPCTSPRPDSTPEEPEDCPV